MDMFKLEQDQEALDEFFQEYSNLTEEMDDLLTEVKIQSGAVELLEDLGVKLAHLGCMTSDYNIYPLVEPFNTLANIIGHFKASGKASILLIDVVTLLLDRMYLMAQSATQSSQISVILINETQTALRQLSIDQSEQNLTKILDLLTGEAEQIVLEDDGVDLFADDSGVDLFDADEPTLAVSTDSTDTVISTSKMTQYHSVDNKHHQSTHSMAIFKLFSTMLDSRHKYWQQRTGFLLALALDMNALANNVVASDQLSAAIHMHDIAMLQLPDDLLYKKCKYDKAEWTLVQEHPIRAYEILLQFNGWEEAAKIVYQHHEKVSGSGYPEGITGDNICNGASIIAICDAYYSMTNVRKDRATKKEAIRAIGEINACSGSQFSPQWVKAFNRVIRGYC